MCIMMFRALCASHLSQELGEPRLQRGWQREQLGRPARRAQGAQRVAAEGGRRRAPVVESRKSLLLGRLQRRAVRLDARALVCSDGTWSEHDGWIAGRALWRLTRIGNTLAA